MLIYGWAIAGLWVLLILTWVALAGRRTPGRRSAGSWRREIALRLVILLLLVLVLHYFRHTIRDLRQYAVNGSVPAGIVGAVLCAAGVGVAVTARFCLGRNWGMPMSRKDKPVLVTSGPYAFVRHPIYGGILLAALGSAIGQSIFWLLPLLMLGPYFVFSAREEENFLTAKFPSHYPVYVRNTKMFFPWLI